MVSSAQIDFKSIVLGFSSSRSAKDMVFLQIWPDAIIAAEFITDVTAVFTFILQDRSAQFSASAFVSPGSSSAGIPSSSSPSD